MSISSDCKRQPCKRHILVNSSVGARVRRWIAAQVLAVIRFRRFLTYARLQSDVLDNCIHLVPSLCRSYRRFEFNGGGVHKNCQTQRRQSRPCWDQSSHLSMVPGLVRVSLQMPSSPAYLLISSDQRSTNPLHVFCVPVTARLDS